MQFQKRSITEGKARILIPKEEKISKKLPVFYNPRMRFTRDLTILFVRQFPGLSICDAMAGSGVRAIRFALECRPKRIVANDINPIAYSLIRQNCELNGISPIIHNENSNSYSLGNNTGKNDDAHTAKKAIEIANTDATLLLLKSSGFDFIDLDVFGSPNFVLDAAVKRIARGGIIAVTATDTAALCGTSPKACRRKYWATPKRDANMHETGLRILIRKVQLIGAQYEKALIPICSYAKEHYMRAFVQCRKGKEAVDAVLKEHKEHNGAGPLWTGSLNDPSLIAKMAAQAKREGKRAGTGESRELSSFLTILREESSLPVVGFHDIHALAKKHRIGSIPRSDAIISRLKKKKHRVAATHFSPTGIRTTANEEEVIRAMKIC
ncbi:TPA: hypothetical protein HA361_03025 [Candidatus Woesearchaeota archaeon]|nr:hypothetical protein [Candidatus Woesearchaeota archaeon]HII68661.1 hypothetical protein [Candidatus Woesearchaeota archaeon]